MAYLAQTRSGQPILILKEGSSRSRGRDAQRNNITAARIVAETIRSTLGPRGMDKMLIDGLGDVTITNDGATILSEIEIEHPAAKIVAEVAKTQDKMVGDGTTTVVILVGELLRKAEELLDQNVHPSIIVSGYVKAMQKALEILNKVSIPVSLEKKEILKHLAVTSMRSKAVGAAREHLAEIVIEAVKQIIEKRGETFVVDVDNIQIIKKTGKSLLGTELVRGIILDKEIVHADMPKRVKNAKIALLKCPLEVEKTEFSAEIRVRAPDQMKSFLNQENKILQNMVSKIASTGANVVICQKGINDMAQHFLAREGILAVRRVKESDIEKLSKATGGRIITNLKDLKPEDLGYAELVEERKIGDDKMIFIEGCRDPKAVAILVRAGLERMADETERSLRDALFVLSDVVKKNLIVAGGGAVEIEIARGLRAYAPKIGGREQLAIEAFAEAVESIPRILAENAGLEPIDILVNLRAEHEKADGRFLGVDVFSGKLINMYEAGVIEPLLVKEHAIKSAVDAAIMILRIDDVIAASKIRGEKSFSGGESE
ncbi:TCP-1/cpn60 chaperonin family protein [Candidatus Bathyarchaeota archaeon]|nr:TCP-1/cpn60 chaperonin family protein [Candidatus Bathyarchaeota archaeon]